MYNRSSAYILNNYEYKIKVLPKISISNVFVYGLALAI